MGWGGQGQGPLAQLHDLPRVCRACMVPPSINAACPHAWMATCHKAAGVLRGLTCRRRVPLEGVPQVEFLELYMRYLSAWQRGGWGQALAGASG